MRVSWLAFLVLLVPVSAAALPVLPLDLPLPGATVEPPVEVEELDGLAPAFVDPLLRQALADGPRPGVLVLEAGRETEVVRRLADLGVDHRHWTRLGMVGLVLHADLLADLETLPGVSGIWRNEEMRPLLDQSTDYVGARPVWTTYGSTGRGVTILVMDSGVDGTHPDLKFREKLLENVVPSRRPSGIIGGSREGVAASDKDGHGTHVAGIVAGSGQATYDSQRFRGVAPGANLVGYQAGLDDGGEITFESHTVLEGFNWALENQKEFGIRIVTNSWGSNGDFDPRSPVNLASFNLYKAGMLVVFAAGNEGTQGDHTLNKYSVAPWVLSVGAGDYFNQVPEFSSRGTDPARSGLAYDHPDIVAPGLDITSAKPVAGQGHGPGFYYQSKSGSSMAAPHVAGIAALLLERNPRLSPDDLMDILTATATPLPRHATWEAGAGYANALKAHQLAGKTEGRLDEFLSGRVKYGGPASGDPSFERDAVTVGYGKGATHRLRSPDLSALEFMEILVLSPRGWIFLLGSFGLACASYAPGPRAHSLGPVTGARPLRSPLATVVGANRRPMMSRIRRSFQRIPRHADALGATQGAPRM